MSAEAARIISAISGRKGDRRELEFGTVKLVSPLTLKVDDLAFDISSGVLRNENIPELKNGDRVLVAAINNTSYVIICKVV